VRFGGVDKLYAAFLNVRRTRRRVRGVQENPGSRDYLARCGIPTQAYRSADAVENFSFRASFRPGIRSSSLLPLKFVCDDAVFRSVDDCIAAAFRPPPTSRGQT
jgi:hypothetical protein